MIVINITASSVEDIIKHIQQKIGGEIKEKYGEYVLKVQNKNAIGTISFISFNWGVKLLEYKITFLEDIKLILDTSVSNPVHFMYLLEGSCYHRFELESERKEIKQFQPAIITSTAKGYNFIYFQKNIKTYVNVIKINRVKFVKKRLNLVFTLNKQLYEVFNDKQYQKAFSYFGTFNLKISKLIKKLSSVKEQGIVKVLIKEGLVYQILSEYILQQDKDKKQGSVPKTKLTNREIKLIKKKVKIINNNLSESYNVKEMASNLGLTEAKLQEGFKLLFSRTVIEYLRYVRLEKAKELLSSNNYNVSQVVYCVGFSSRSYFSKIFKEKYGLTPSQFLKNKQIIQHQNN